VDVRQSASKVPVFAILISEKGGAERREAFDQPEIHIGRVQGNDLMLPKGNVSKRHAKLVFRDSRFIVTDLNSTNGTYVNRRRISQATIVRQGDRIYIGDFVIRIEAGEEGSGMAQSRGSVAPIPLREPMMTSPDTTQRSKGPGTPASPINYPQVPPAPRLPSAARAETVAAQEALASSAPAPRIEPPSVVERLPSVPREDSIDPETTAYRSAVAALVGRVSARLEAGVLDSEISETVRTRVDKAVTEHLADLRKEDVVGASVVDERLRRDALAELLDLGALGPLIEDESVVEIVVAGTSPLIVSRGGRRMLIDPPISSEASLRRVLARLSRRSERPIGNDEGLIFRKLPNGFRLTALVGPRTPSGTLLRLTRIQRVDSTLDDLVRAGTVSRAVATFFRHCMSVRANILVSGPQDARPISIAAALASASPDGHVIELFENDLIVSSSVHVSHVDLSEPSETTDSLVDFAGRVPDARIVVENLTGATSASALEIVSGGFDGLVAVLPAASLRRGLARLPAELSAARPGLGMAAAKEWIAGTFDVLIDVARLRDGRHRVIRVAEPIGVIDGEIALRDIFTFVIERTATGGSVEGTFQATGVAPRVVGDMTARGIHVDSGVFSRPPSR
jgi:pilus assembly protein CpaF